MYNPQPQYFGAGMPQNINNPYADNPKFLKEIFSSKYVIGIMVSLAVTIGIFFYYSFNLLYTINSLMSDLKKFDNSYFSDFSTNNYMQTFLWLIFIVFFIIALIYLLSFIGYMIMFIKSKTLDDSSSPKAGLTLNFIFSIFSIVHWSIMLFNALLVSIPLIIVMMFSDSFSSYSGSDGKYNTYFSPTASSSSQTSALNIFVSILLFLMILFMVSALIWSINSVRFFSAAKKTYECKGMFSNGAGVLNVFSIVSAIFELILALIIILTMIFDSSHSIMSSSSTVANVIFAVLIISHAAFFFFTSKFVSLYSKCLNAAKYSLVKNGVNIYTGAVSNATAYYQSTYTSPYQNNVNPPYNVQNNFPVNSYQQNPNAAFKNQSSMNIGASIPSTQNSDLQTNNLNNINTNSFNQNNIQSIPQNNGFDSTNKNSLNQNTVVNNSSSIENSEQTTSSTSDDSLAQNSDSIKLNGLCPNCGHPNNPNALFCINCGMKL